uniref:GCF C-terminal domain-containing protein n=1 Tax=Leptobrachium leishanense TaxID=445787 RepID=A0A8C5MDN2_9ANUR
MLHVYRCILYIVTCLQVHSVYSHYRIMLRCKDLFDDVHEDFHRIKNILSKFQEWRRRFSESYYDAYISLCIPKLLNPLLRAQLLTWSPLEQFEWYSDVEDFSWGSEDPESNPEDSPDHHVLSAVVEKCVLPKVSGELSNAAPQQQPPPCILRRPVSDERSDHVHVAAQFNGLLNSLVSRLQKAIEDNVFIPLYAKSVLEDETSPHSQFQERQFWSAVKMLQNVLSWDGFLPEESLQELGLDKLLNRYLLLILLNARPGPDMVKKCSKIVECLPQSWFKGFDSGSSITRLSNFSKHLLQCAHTLHTADDGYVLLVSLLKKLKAMDYVETILGKYNVAEMTL